ncbi:MAG: gamma-glutamyltransferase [Chloroflexi bacterium]|nr:gamma-glutamyltransferase [Chloroflexota bacterium]
MAIGLSTYRPLITGTTHMVSSGHYLATAAGYRVLEQGGNATDAGVAAGITINVVLPQYTSFGGVAPIILHDAQKQETVTISGLGRWPKAASIDYFNQHAGGDLPAGVLRTVTPAAADGWLTALKLYGTMTFEQVVTPALELAEGGFPIPASLHRALARAGDELTHDEGDSRAWRSNRDVFYPGGQALETGALLVQKDLARTFRRLIQVEKDNASSSEDHECSNARSRERRENFRWREATAHATSNEEPQSCEGEQAHAAIEDIAKEP